MTDRVVTYTLRGNITDLAAKMTAAGASVGKLGSEMTALDAKGAKMRAGLTTLGTSAGKLGLGAAAGLGAITLVAMRFDKQMSAVQAATHETAASMELLSKAAIKAGADTAFSAVEAGRGIEELAKAGVSTADILGGALNGSLDLAAAGAIGVGEAAETAATAMTQFGLAGTEVPHIADLLAAAAGKAQGGVSDMGMALKQSGLVASQTGLTIEETTGALAAFASAGLVGSDAGTSFKTMLQALTPTGGKAAKAMDELGITAYDAQGNFVGMAKFAASLQNALKDLTVEQQNAAMKTIFGSDAVRAASVVFKQGESGIQGWIDKVDDSGYAAETAATRLDNLSGDLEALSGSIETALIGTGAGATGPLREMVQAATELVNAYNKLPAPIKNGAVAVLGLTAVLGAGMFVVSRAVSGYANLKGSVNDLGVKFSEANKRALALRGGLAAAGIGLASLSAPAHDASEGLGVLTDVAASAAMGFAVGGPWGAAIGGGIGLITSLGSSSGDSAAQMQTLTATLDQQTGALTENSAKWAAKQIQDSGFADDLRDAGISLATATDAVLGNADAMGELEAAAKGANFEQQRGILSLLAMSDMVKKGTADTRELATATDNSTEAQSAAAAGLSATGAAAGDAAEEVKSLSDALDGLLDPLLDQEDASNAWKDSLAGLTDELKKTGASLDDGTVKGRASQDAIRDRVKALKASIAADEAAGVGADELGAKMLRGAAQILKSGEAAGISRSEMKKYLATLGLTPSQIETVIKADTSEALSKLYALQTVIRDTHGKTIGIHVNTTYGGGTQTRDADGSIHLGDGRRMVAFANGGVEDHQAQIGAGDYSRIWNEPETGGEAYIPLALSKRKRSQQIAMETVSRLGGVAAFANGGVSGGGPAQPLSLSLVGAQVAIDPRTNIATFVRGEVQAGLASQTRYDAASTRQDGRR